MQTFETLIVFGALVAIIALVAIAIDWVGKPLRNRRFIPRIYRYDDEILPSAFPAGPPMLPPDQAPPMVVVSAPADQRPPRAVATVDTELRPPTRPLDAPVAQPAAAQAERRFGSAFSDLVSKTTDEVPTRAPSVGAVVGDAVVGGASSRPHDLVAEAGTLVATGGSWEPGMSLDAQVGDRKPTPAVKAERFWKSVAASAAGSHFDDDNTARMADGKAPRRRNPRTGHYETMQLVGLRRASLDSAVRMKWPDDSVDPWSGR